MSETSLWARFKTFYLRYPELGLAVDVSRMRFPGDFFATMAMPAQQALAAMRDLEAGAIANPDEGRMVGHYWLRAPELAPDDAIRREIVSTRAAIADFAAAVHRGDEAPVGGGRFTDALIVGIGGSALGPQLLAEALWTRGDRLRLHFLDNTDPDGFDLALDRLGEHLRRTLIVVISKSGGTKETRNGMLEVAARCRAAAIAFAPHAVAVTGAGSALDREAAAAGWRRRFPMWDWVGGRTSVTSAVGLLPLALQGADCGSFLGGAAAMDRRTRAEADPRRNAALLLALMWHYAGRGRGDRDMVVMPYKDRLALFSKYLQQLVMESLGKECDRDGRVVHQGLAVYGNKGSTDQHAYVQQLRDGPDNFFATFIEVRQSRAEPGLEVEPGITSGDYLHGFLRGTRQALADNGRESITLSIPEVSAYHLGALIALYERAVGFYASLVNINAYHQPGVEAGKKAAGEMIDLQRRVVSALASLTAAGRLPPPTVEELAADLGADPETVFHVLNHLAHNAAAPDLRAAAGRLTGG